MICWMRRRGRTGRRTLAAGLTAAGALALLADVRPALPQTPFDLYRERTAMLAAGERCRLFDAALTAALASGAAQARTGALRAGYAPEALDRGAADARAQATAMACGSARLQQAAERTREAFRAYAALRRLSFPGERAAWRADRGMPLQTASWRLAQDSQAGEDRLVFGLAGLQGTDTVTLAVAAADGAQPYAARLVLRDPARLPQPWLTSSVGPAPLGAPMRGAERVMLSQDRGPADPALRPAGAPQAVAFRFPPEARAAIERLDPRESFAVELLYASRDGERVRTAFLEVGDFQAGLVFLASGRR